jgi:hypothetical protein
MLSGCKALDTQNSSDYQPIRRRSGWSLKRPLDEYNREAEARHFLDKLHDQKDKTTQVTF